MSRLVDAATQLQTTDTIGTLVTTLEEVSVMRMQRVRDSVLKTRGYLDGLLDVFVSVRQVHSREINELYGQKKWWQRSAAPRSKDNGKTILVLVAPTQRLSGEVGRHVFEQFASAVEKAPTAVDIAIVGQVGYDLFQARFGKKRSASFFNWQENKEDQADLISFLTVLQSYEKVTVFSAEFMSLIKQEPKARTLTGNEALQQQTEGAHASQMYLCEPTITELVNFFEHQVVSSLFKQNLQEAHLAHLGSRVTALEQSTQTIAKERSKLQRRLQQLQRQQQQAKQRQRMAGMHLWFT